MHLHTCAQPTASVFADVYVGVKKNTCVIYTPAYAIVPKTPVPKCTQHSLQKNAHIYIYTHTCTRIHITANKHARAFMTPINTQRHWHQDSQTIHKYAYTYIWTDGKLATKLTKNDQQPVFILPARWWPDTLPEFESGGWWQRPHKQVRCRRHKCSLVENPSFKSSNCQGCWTSYFRIGKTF